jgi:hypothetical protein
MNGAFMAKLRTKEAHSMFLTNESDTLRERWLAAGLDRLNSGVNTRTILIGHARFLRKRIA